MATALPVRFGIGDTPEDQYVDVVTCLLVDALLGKGINSDSDIKVVSLDHEESTISRYPHPAHPGR